MPKDIPRHIPIPIPAMLFKTFIKTTLQSIAAIIPIVTPIIILLLFISFILHKFLFIEQSIPYSSIKEYPYMKNAIVFLYNYFARLLRNLSPLHTDLARSSVLYLWDRKIRKNPNPFPIWKIWFGLYWFGVGNRTGFSRLAAARSAPLSGHTVAWFTTASSSPVFALIFLLLFQGLNLLLFWSHNHLDFLYHRCFYLFLLRLFSYLNYFRNLNFCYIYVILISLQSISLNLNKEDLIMANCKVAKAICNQTKKNSNNTNTKNATNRLKNLPPHKRRKSPL